MELTCVIQGRAVLLARLDNQQQGCKCLRALCVHLQAAWQPLDCGVSSVGTISKATQQLGVERGAVVPCIGKSHTRHRDQLKTTQGFEFGRLLQVRASNAHMLMPLQHR
jgi:hypothetical protein